MVRRIEIDHVQYASIIPLPAPLALGFGGIGPRRRRSPKETAGNRINATQKDANSVRAGDPPRSADRPVARFSFMSSVFDHATVGDVRCFSGRHHDSLDLYHSIVWANASGQVLRVGRQPSSLRIFDESIA